MGEMADELYAREEMRAWSWNYFCKKETRWHTKGGRRMLPEEMTRTHRFNVIRLVANRYFGGDIQEAINTVKLVRKMDKLNRKEAHVETTVLEFDKV